MISQRPDIDKMYLYTKSPYEAKYKFLINKRESAGLKHFNDSKVLLNTQMIWMIFIKTLNNTTKIKNVKY